MTEVRQDSILVVEDNPVMADVLKRTLSRAQLVPRIARNGQEAFELVLAERFDMVVTDFQMPRMCGDEFVRRLRKTALNGDVPVIFVSGKGLEVDTEQLRQELGITAFLFKPFSPVELIRVVRAILAVRATTRIPADGLSTLVCTE